ncbi:type II toxin-antitoxin system HipA family toxin [Alteromonas sp. H39]|uniref:type II toxin-antitoxin system HipA family toxin n=1 Tax=Alteromonas sp. H39 TaxID=3389876 RepID=UPI0039E0CD3E
MISEAYVFVDGLEDIPIICGFVKINPERNTGQFVYGKSYLIRDDAFALDPINLPLATTTYNTNFNHGLFGVLSDAGADSWGERIILSLHKTKPQNALEFLLAGSGMGVGCLVFSLSQKASKHKVNKNTLGDIPMLLKAKDDILADKKIPDEAKKAFEFGSSMGGARPKTLINDNNKHYLAKFNRPDDRINVVKVEHAAMQMLSELPCRVAKTKTIETPNGDVFLSERFDISNNTPTHHFLSANAIFHTAKVNSSVLKTGYTYGFLAEYIRKHGAEPADAHDLYYRMVFNAFMGNTDDHSRNHALLYSLEDKHWRLSPAYDVLPINNAMLHGIGLGEEARHATITNLLSQSDRFGIKHFKARKIISQVEELTAEWHHYFKQHGVGEGDLERLNGIIPTLL